MVDIRPWKWADGYDWKITLRKALSHAAYSVCAILLVWASNSIASLQIQDQYLIGLVPIVQALLKALINWLQER